MAENDTQSPAQEAQEETQETQQPKAPEEEEAPKAEPQPVAPLRFSEESREYMARLASAIGLGDDASNYRNADVTADMVGKLLVGIAPHEIRNPQAIAAQMRGIRIVHDGREISVGEYLGMPPAERGKIAAQMQIRAENKPEEPDATDEPPEDQLKKLAEEGEGPVTKEKRRFESYARYINGEIAKMRAGTHEGEGYDRKREEQLIALYSLCHLAANAEGDLGPLIRLFTLHKIQDIKPGDMMNYFRMKGNAAKQGSLENAIEQQRALLKGRKEEAIAHLQTIKGKNGEEIGEVAAASLYDALYSGNAGTGEVRKILSGLEESNEFQMSVFNKTMSDTDYENIMAAGDKGLGKDNIAWSTLKKSVMFSGFGLSLAALIAYILLQSADAAAAA